ncbi:MAG: tyrosine-type recombinase/integrase, partial [Enterococcus sp.]|nr:tyrosine-type recombinase/integrase [Enterococcus sp.]
KYELASNQQLKQEYDVYLDKTIAATGDRGWTNSEYREMQQLLSVQSSNSPVAAITSDVMTISRTMGLRVSEAVCMRRSQAEKALRTGHYEVLGEAKNGMHRSVPLSSEVRQILTTRLPHIARGGRLFVSEDEKAHQVVNRIEKHLERYRGTVETLEGALKRVDISNEVNPLTFHGLRYSYVQDRMTDLQAQGLNWKAAAKIVTQEVGHGRIEVVKVYTNGK